MGNFSPENGVKVFLNVTGLSLDKTAKAVFQIYPELTGSNLATQPILTFIFKTQWI